MFINKIATFTRIPFANKYVKDVKNIQKKLNFGRNNLTEEQKEEELKFL
jgi:hypothetical protein